MRSARLWAKARLAQSAERKALNLVVVGSSPTVGVLRSSPVRRKKKIEKIKISIPIPRHYYVTMSKDSPKTRHSCRWTFEVLQSTAPGHSNGFRKI